MNHKDKARECLKENCISVERYPDLVGSITKALEQVERETIEKCAEVAESLRYNPKEIRFCNPSNILHGVQYVGGSDDTEI